MDASSDPHDALAHRIVQRQKELDLAHSNRLRPGGLERALRLRFLRTFAARLFSPVVRITPVPLPAPAPGALQIGFVGHATFQIVSHGARVLTDPLFSDTLHGFRRRIGACIAPGDIQRTSAVLLSHAHTDRFAPDSLRRIPKSATVFVPHGALEGHVRALGFAEVRVLLPEQDAQHGDLTITATPARHDGRGGRGGSTGGTNGYILRERDVTAYYAGATGYFSGFTDIGKRFRPDIALLPIAGYEPTPLRENNLSPLDALYAFDDLGARCFVPYGFDAFTLGYEAADEPLGWLGELCAERPVERRATVVRTGGQLRVERGG
ncbi:MAG: MBL fold metallo-hydrolase [Deltaproteobacteria bacterium]|nr:MBL fold metallo-hydrolase [Deltaproteobacteria bacterium]